MDPVTLGALLLQAAPRVAGWLGGDSAKEKAEAVVATARKLTGIDAPEAAVKAVVEDPEKLRQFELSVMQLQLEETRVVLADVQNARAMQAAALLQDDLFSKRFAYYFAVGWSAFSAVYFTAVTFCAMPSQGQRIADTILGFLLGTAIASIFSWLYGTTVRNAKKDETIAVLSGTSAQQGRG